ncbi:MAG: hypothetical protein GXY68_10200 [Chloroflexi bacterium]|nr:hypothetical protein [Chloroflexota bacterium]
MRRLWSRFGRHWLALLLVFVMTAGLGAPLALADDEVEAAQESAVVAADAIAYIGDIGTATVKSSGTTLTITTTAAVAAGDAIIVGYATDPDQNLAVGVTDSVGNTYEQAAMAVNYGNGRTYIFAAYNVTALPSGGTITITGNPAVTARAAVASVFGGLGPAGALDQAQANPLLADQQTPSGTAPTVGPTGMTSQPNELLISVIGTEGPSEDAAGAWGNSFLSGPRAGTTGGTADTNWTVSLGYRIVAATGEYSAGKTGITSRRWAATLATFGSEAILSPDTYNIVLGRPTNNAITASLLMSEDGDAYIEYGTASGVYTSGSTLTEAVTAGEPVKLVLDGLDADTAYYYRLAFQPDGSSAWLSSAEFSFHTQRGPGQTFTFTITSDSHLGQTFSGNTPERYEQTTMNVAADEPDLHLDLGDAFIIDATNQAGVDAIYEAQRPYFGNYGHSAPVFLVIGNHENEEGWNLDDAPFSKALGSIKARKAYFANPVPDGFYTGNEDLLPEVGGDQFREDYYAWEWGDALFVVLDPFQYTMVKPYGTIMGSGEDDDEAVSGDQWNWTLGQEQFEWFKQTLEQSDAPFKFVFAHHMVGGLLEVSGAAGTPSYVRGGAEAAPYFEWGGRNALAEWIFDSKRPGWGDDAVHQLMVANGVSAFFHGHDHQFVHEEIDGIAYQLVPGAGMNDLGFDLYADSPYAVDGGNLPSGGHVRVTVAPDGAQVEYVRSEAGGGGINGRVDHSYLIEPGAPPEGSLGDVNDSGAADSTDALIILSADIGNDTTAFCPLNCGDVNGDGLVNSTDALIILSYDVGTVVPFPIETGSCPLSVTPPPGCTP